jgi:hypothetical protein
MKIDVPPKMASTNRSLGKQPVGVPHRMAAFLFLGPHVLARCLRIKVLC